MIHFEKQIGLRLLVILCFLSFFAVSCVRQSKFLLEGNVLNGTTNTPYNHIKVVAYKELWNHESPRTEYLGEAYTYENGTFHIIYELEDKEYGLISLKFFENETKLIYQDFVNKLREDVNTNFYISDSTTIRLLFANNTNPLKPDEMLRILISPGYVDTLINPEEIAKVNGLLKFRVKYFYNGVVDVKRVKTDTALGKFESENFRNLLGDPFINDIRFYNY